ncbi:MULTISPECIES: TetR/AcrR family transcriptional regulator C-terminal domain-containing protein [unclassified Janthinobacterium]|uniref:TetR/AcrR family transcriptional regulator C-terminal domain-containing protein n=1 Tax=unclassified Janthinobacterium TaxID=2610881 RepID=UPI0025AF0516|nr:MULTISPECIES: TetR/AcrR family transcriptional regulator C-terminal domain-containing protein [unclassified Janthinobacterium]MDN2678895.1 TetR/AcrR family transcriptional regulator C-terminal domain-containing protein [Janthinobacterium sp. SUN033]MDO8068069.1 TetR/AcrR family transcriptional regulator C-terminal domain-containing protein [Janthinobacterium sp. SUN206]MDO8075365.1 TetR/AcrR family transcriptional regulator C-terminal domain-containing protein [Janthinobacterium sp. SUN176]
MKIQREAVVARALELLDEVGIEGLTMRRLADAMGIKAASLYWHFANKQALLDGMADVLIEDVARNVDADAGWEAQLRQVAAQLRAALSARRDGVRVFGGTYVISENVFRVAEALIGPMRAAGASEKLASWSAFTLLYYVLGFVMEAQGTGPGSAAMYALSNRRAAFAAMAADHYPHVLASMDAIFNAEIDDRFNAGLDLIMIGLREKIKTNQGIYN